MRHADAAATTLGGADPSVIRVGATYISVQSVNGGIAVRPPPRSPARRRARARSGRTAATSVRSGPRRSSPMAAATTSTSRPGAAPPTACTRSARRPGQRLHGRDASSRCPTTSGPSTAALFTFNGQRWFVWSGWAGDTNVEQNIYLARMSSPHHADRRPVRHLPAPRDLGAGRRQPVHQRGPRADPGPQRPAAHRLLRQRQLERPVLPRRPAAARRRRPDVRVGLVQVATAACSARTAPHDVRLGPDPVRQRPRPPQLRAARRRHRHQPAGRPDGSR